MPTRLTLRDTTLAWLVVTTLMAAEPAGSKPAASETPRQVPHGLSSEEAIGGWLALFDGKSTFGFHGATLHEDGKPTWLQGGITTSVFADCLLRVTVVQEGELSLGDLRFLLQVGDHTLTVEGGAGPLRLSDRLGVTRLALKPQKMKSLWNGKNLTGWDRRGRVPVPPQTGAHWTVENGVLRVVGGPEALEYAPAEGEHLFQDFIAQLVVRTRARDANGGFFFRNQPGKTMMGYEAQLHHRWYPPGGDVHGYTTGGIDDRQQARAPVAQDEIPFCLTVIAHGPHIATWVNGFQTVDWTDERRDHDNPRVGRRLAAGTIQLQAHDPETDLEFHAISVRELPDR